MKDQKRLLIIFQKNIIPGKVKTRLAKDIGNENAVKIYKMLIKKTWRAVHDLYVTKWVYYSEFIDNVDIWTKENAAKRVQSGNDLGDRMYNAFEKGFDSGFKYICIIGTDCYDITEKILEESFSKLENSDFVIGPALDGGYYLIGMKNLNEKVFRNKKWSTSFVLKDTIRDITDENLQYSLLEPLNDIDNAEDLAMIKSLK